MTQGVIKTEIVGKSSNVIGNKDAPLVLRGSSIKVQWGNKFIDIIKNGKINVDAQQVFKTISDESQLKQDGIYLLDNSIWVVIGGTKTQLPNDNTSYVSYLTEQKDITADQKNTALTNIGFYYKTLSDAEAAGLKSGIIYVQEDNKLYFINNGMLTQYNPVNVPNEQPINTESIYIKDNMLIIDGHEWVYFDNDAINVYDKIITHKGLSSNNANSNYGYRLYMQDGKSILEIDSIIERNKNSEEAHDDYPIYSKYNNIITDSAIDNNQVICKLKYPSKYLAGDTVLVYNGDSLQNYEVISSEENSVILDNTNNQNFTGQYIYTSSYPYIYFKDNNLLVQDGVNTPIKIGEFNEQDIPEIKSCQPINSTVSMFANNFIGVNSKLYDSIFKVRCDYPKYDEGIVIPEESNDQTIVTSAWVQKVLSSRLDNIQGNESVDKIITDLNTIKNDYVKKEELSRYIADAISLYKGDTSNSIIILSGTIRYDLSSSKFIFKGTKKQDISDLKVSSKDGLLIIELLSNSNISITSAHITQADSGEAPSMATGITKLEKNGLGAHWYGTNFNNNVMYIREFHQGNENNDSWLSTTWTDTEKSAYIINITVFGYIINE